MATLDDLLASKTAAEVQAEILADLASEAVTGVSGGMPTTSWQPGSVPRTLIAALAEQGVDYNTFQRAVASGVLLELSSGAWLTLLALNVYGVTRDAAVTTVGLVQLTDTSGSAVLVNAGSLTASDSVGRRYQNNLSATVPANSAHFVRVAALNDDPATFSPADYNVSNNVITTLVSALAGVTVNNPIPWITQVGTGSTKTRGYVNLTSTGGGAISVGGVTVSNGTWTFTNVSADTLSAGTAKAVLFEATANGGQYNVGNGEIDTVTVDPLGDITCANPAPASGSWIFTSGSDEQSDASLKQECREKWGTLGVGWTADAISYLVKQAGTSATITRTKVETNPGGVAGLVGLTIASVAGVISSGDVAIAQAYMDANRTLTSDITVASATSTTLTISGTVYCPSGYSAQAELAATTNLIALEASIPIGGDDDANNEVQIEDILSAIKDAEYSAAGVNINPASPIRIQLTSPTADVALTAYQVVDFDYSGLVFQDV